MPVPVPAADGAAAAARRSLAPWLGVLFVLVFALNLAGGWVRLSGSGVAIPQWPLIETAHGRTLLPPFSATGWEEMRLAWVDHQERLRERIERGELSPVNLGRRPADAGEFRAMFLTEWSHRLLAALVGVLTLACLGTALRRPALRRQVGGPLVAAALLILAQAVLGGLLVAQGTTTRWLFLHQGNAGLIMALLLWSLLRLLAPAPAPAAVPRRRWLALLLHGAVAWTWLQLLTGALVASSRHGLPDGAGVPLADLPRLWIAGAGAAWNLLDNARLHQWLHRWPAWGLAALLLATYLVARGSRCGVRLRLALQVSATFLAVQIVLGLGTVLAGPSPLIALAHQAMGMCLLLSLVLAMHDARREPADVPAPVGAGVPA